MRNPVHHIGKEVIHRYRGHREFLAQLGTATVDVEDIRSDTDLSKLRSLLSRIEDANEKTRVKDNSILKECILNLIDGVVHQVIGFKVLGENVQLDQLFDVCIEACS